MKLLALLFVVLAFADTDVEIETEKNDKKTIQCSLCEWVLVELEKYITENSTEKEIEQALEKLCAMMPASLQATCDQFVEAYGEQIIELIIQELDPDVICQLIGLCKVRRQNEMNSILCEACKFVVKEVDKAIGSERTKEKVESQLKKVCGKLPSFLKEVCDDLIDDEYPKLVEFLLQKLSPDVICAKIHACKSRDNGLKCETCKWLIGEADKLIGSDRTKEKVEAALKKVCGRLPQLLRDLCDDIVDEFAPKLIDMLVQKISPDVICAKLHMCGSRANKVECDICKWIFAAIEKELSAAPTKEEVEKVLDGYCDKIPVKMFSDMCKDIISSEYDNLVDWLVNMYPPVEICKLMQICPV